MLAYRRNIEFPQGDYVAHKKEKAAKTWDSLERLTNRSKIYNKINIKNKDAKVNVKVGGGKC